MLDTAEVWARRSTCSRLHVGAVLARDGRVLATAYNGAPVGLAHCDHQDDAPCTSSVHAEANALLWAARHGVNTSDSVMYCTHSPCLPCSSLMINAGVGEVVYRRDYRSQDGLNRLSEAGLLVRQHMHKPACLG